MDSQRVVLDPCSWKTYECILAEHVEKSSPRFAYFDGTLDIVAPGADHERLKCRVTHMISALCEELDVEMEPLGSTTQKRLPQRVGLDPDASFCFGELRLDSPDLIVEITRLADHICALMEIPEIWRCDVDGVTILQLHEGSYETAERSLFLPVTAAELTLQVRARDGKRRNEWVRGVRQWARGLA